MDPDVPLLIPDVNPEHTALIRAQRARSGGRGFIVTNPNCTTTHLVCALKPLQDAFGLTAVNVVSMQAISKHLKVLEAAGLISRSRDAQRRPVHLEAGTLGLATTWLERYRLQAEARYRRLDAVLAELNELNDNEKEQS